MGKIRKLLDRLITAILVLQGVSLIVIIGISVFYRYIIEAALSWPGEVAGIVFVWYTLLGIVLLSGSESHIAFDFIGKSAPRFVARSIKLLSQFIVLIYGIIMAVYGWKYLVLFPHETSPAAGINLTWLKIAIPATGVLLVFYVGLNIIDSFRQVAPDTKKGDVA